MRDYSNTIPALAVYDQKTIQFEADLENAKTNEEVMAAFEMEKVAIQELQDAFQKDVSDINSPHSCRMADPAYIRYVATGTPGPATVTIGNVMFGRLTGEVDSDGVEKFRVTSHIGGERVKLLQDVRDGDPLPHAVVLVGKVGGGLVRIPADAVNWNTSGIKPTSGTPNAAREARRETQGTCTVAFVTERFELSILNSAGLLVSRMNFDHHAERDMSQFIKFWLEHRELRPIHIGVIEVEFRPEHVEEGYYVAGSQNRPAQHGPINTVQSKGRV